MTLEKDAAVSTFRPPNDLDLEVCVLVDCQYFLWHWFDHFDKNAFRLLRRIVFISIVWGVRSIVILNPYDECDACKTRQRNNIIISKKKEKKKENRLPVGTRILM